MRIPVGIPARRRVGAPEPRDPIDNQSATDAWEGPRVELPSSPDRNQKPHTEGVEEPKSSKGRPAACLGCSKESGKGPNLCSKCSGCLRMGLLDARNKTDLGTGRYSYCLKCRSLVQGEHCEHENICIPLDVFDGKQVAWVKNEEKWAEIFDGVQSDLYRNRLHGRPFLLHTAPGLRCEQCAAHIADEDLYGTLVRFCTIECWARSSEGAAGYDWIDSLLHSDFGQHWTASDAFCIVCRCLFRTEDEPDHGHESLGVIKAFVGGTAAIKIEIPSDHFMASPWRWIKDLAGGVTLSSPNRLFRLRDEGAQRCRCCNLRLEDGGGEVCSLECSLSDPLMLPRPLQIQKMEQEKLFKHECKNTEGHNLLQFYGPSPGKHGLSTPSCAEDDPTKSTFADDPCFKGPSPGEQTLSTPSPASNDVKTGSAPTEALEMKEEKLDKLAHKGPSPGKQALSTPSCAENDVKTGGPSCAENDVKTRCRLMESTFADDLCLTKMKQEKLDKVAGKVCKHNYSNQLTRQTVH